MHRPTFSLVLLALVLVGPGTQAQNRGRIGFCPSTYMTTINFNVKKIAEMVGNTGYQTLMMIGSEEDNAQTCQKLQLFDGTSYRYTYIDSEGKLQQVNGRYIATPTSYRNEGALELSGLPSGVLGANIFGVARLLPLVNDQGMEVFLSCHSRGILYSENVYVFVPNTPASLRDHESFKEILSVMGIPHSTILQRSDQKCVVTEEPVSDASASTADSPSSASDVIASPAATAEEPAASDTSLKVSPDEGSPAGGEEDSGSVPASNSTEEKLPAASADASEESATEASASQ